MKLQTSVFQNHFYLLTAICFLFVCTSIAFTFPWSSYKSLSDIVQNIFPIITSLFILSLLLSYLISYKMEQPLSKIINEINNFKNLAYNDSNQKGNEWIQIQNAIQRLQNDNSEQNSLNNIHMESLETKVKERTRELESEKAMVEFSRLEAEFSRMKAEEALLKLRNSQDQLIQSEKMLALGQLVDSVAHELNTPLGAIKACSESIKKSTQNSATFLFELIRYLKNQEVNLMQSLLILNFNNSLSSREEREFKKSMSRDLESRHIAYATDIAETLVPLGITDVGPQYDILWKHEKFRDILYFLELEIGLEKRANIIEKAVDKTSKIINALKNFSHNSSTSKQRVDLLEGIETTITIYGNFFRKGIRLHKKYEATPLIECYPEKLIHVWTHLLSNSIHAVSEMGGDIMITVKELNQQDNGNRVSVHFEDNGNGIPEEMHEKIFEPFFTTKKSGEGTGLGLHICKQIISQHGGVISLQSSPGKTVFTVELPY